MAAQQVGWNDEYICVQRWMLKNTLALHIWPVHCLIRDKSVSVFNLPSVLMCLECSFATCFLGDKPIMVETVISDESLELKLMPLALKGPFPRKRSRTSRPVLAKLDAVISRRLDVARNHSSCIETVL